MTDDDADKFSARGCARGLVPGTVAIQGGAAFRFADKNPGMFYVIDTIGRVRRPG